MGKKSHRKNRRARHARVTLEQPRRMMDAFEKLLPRVPEAAIFPPAVVETASVDVAERDGFRSLLDRFNTPPPASQLTPLEYYGRWLEYAWTYLQLPATRAQFAGLRTRYGDEQCNRFDELLDDYATLCDHVRGADVLGPLYQELGGLTVTLMTWPYAYAQALGVVLETVLPKFKERIDEGKDPDFGFMDAWCVSGVRMLALGAMVRDLLGEAALACVRFEWVDAEPRHAAMTAIQMRMNGLDEQGHSMRHALRLERVKKAGEAERARAAATARPTLDEWHRIDAETRGAGTATPPLGGHVVFGKGGLL